MAVPISFRQRLERKLPRLAKSARQWTRALVVGGRPDTRLVFVVGAQRSGTRLPLHILDQAAAVSTFSEGVDPFFDRVLLRPLDRIEALVRRSSAPIIALKPICETHRVNELLDRFPRSRAVWIFRHYEDTVSSASLKWASGGGAVRRIAHGDIAPDDWRMGGLTAEKLQLVRRLYRDDLSLHEANAVLWYLRNDLFFDLKANERRDVLLVQYQELIEHPGEQVERLFAFIGTPVPRGAAACIRGSARTKRSFPAMAPEITALCEGVYQRLVAHGKANTSTPAPAEHADAAMRRTGSPSLGHGHR